MRPASSILVLAFMCFVGAQTPAAGAGLAQRSGFSSAAAGGQHRGIRIAPFRQGRIAGAHRHDGNGFRGRHFGRFGAGPFGFGWGGLGYGFGGWGGGGSTEIGPGGFDREMVTAAGIRPPPVGEPVIYVLNEPNPRWRRHPVAAEPRGPRIQSNPDGDWTDVPREHGAALTEPPGARIIHLRVPRGG